MFSTRMLFAGLVAIVLFQFYASTDLLSAAPATGESCTPELWTPPSETGGVGIRAVLKDIPIGTKWKDLPAATRTRVSEHSDNRLAAFRARWARDALAKKERILLECPTAEMTSAIDDYYRGTFDTVVPSTFSLKDVKNPALARALIRNYLGALAARRGALAYETLRKRLRNLDWDGKSIFDSFRLPDQQTYEDIKSFNASVVVDLRKIDDAAISDQERALKHRALFHARGQAVGAFTSDAFGGADLEMACKLIALNNDIIQAYKDDNGRPRIFQSDDEVLREVNAIYLHNTSLKWLDVGTWNSALNLPLCNHTDDDYVKKYVGDPATNDVAKGIILLKEWWIERVLAGIAALNECSIYSREDRARIWEAFTADLHANNDGTSSMTTFKAQFERYRADRLSKYRDIAKLALQQVFPDESVLDGAQRQKVLAVIDGANRNLVWLVPRCNRGRT
jgi:hypothetical protein